MGVEISKFVYHESDIFLNIGFAEIPYINKGLLVCLVFSMGMGVNIPWVGGSIYKPMVYRHFIFFNLMKYVSFKIL
jgi:hypothetical protein